METTVRVNRIRRTPVSKPKRIDKNCISPEWPVRDTAIAYLLARNADSYIGWVILGCVVGALWIYTARQVVGTETIGIAGDCPE